MIGLLRKRSIYWLKNAMDIGLQTLQRREDIVSLKFSDIKKEYLYVIQNKTKKQGESAYLKIKIESPIREVLARCRDRMLSPYLVHRRPDRFSEQNKNAKSKKHYTQVTPDYLSKSFTEIRDTLSIFKNTPVEERSTFSDIKKEYFSGTKKEYLYVIQNKTKKHGESAYLKIKIESPLKEILLNCRDRMLSPYLVHRRPGRFSEQNKNAKSKKHYTQVTPDYLSKSFAEIRDTLNFFKDTPVEERPTFHEIRSLGIKLYEDQGMDAQFLAGHKRRAMTDKYKEGHEIQWTEVSAGLPLSMSLIKKYAS